MSKVGVGTAIGSGVVALTTAGWIGAAVLALLVLALAALAVWCISDDGRTQRLSSILAHWPWGGRPPPTT
jgi:hypothetical protein